MHCECVREAGGLGCTRSHLLKRHSVRACWREALVRSARRAMRVLLPRGLGHGGMGVWMAGGGLQGVCGAMPPVPTDSDDSAHCGSEHQRRAQPAAQRKEWPIVDHSESELFDPHEYPTVHRTHCSLRLWADSIRIIVGCGTAAESNRIESNRIESNRIESNRIESGPSQ